MKTFFQKRDERQEEATKQMIKNKDLVDVWTDDSTLNLKPDGTVTITYDNKNIPQRVFPNCVIGIMEFFKNYKEEN